MLDLGGDLGEAVQVVAEEVEALVLGEAGVEERAELAVVQRSGEDAAHAALRQEVELVLDVVHGGCRAVGDGAQHHGVVGAAPGRHLQVGACAPPPIIGGHDARPGREGW